MRGIAWGTLPGSQVRRGILGERDKFLVSLYGCVSVPAFPCMTSPLE